MFAIRYTGGEGETRTHTPFPATGSLANFFLTIRITSPYGCGSWTRTNEMQESKSCALPLGDTAIFIIVLSCFLILEVELWVLHP